MAEFEEVGQAYVRIRPDTSGFAAETSTQVKGAMSGISSSIASAGRDILKVSGVAAIGVAGIGVAAAVASANFNESMSGVGAVAGATAEQLGLLREEALQAGADTVFSASEAAEAEAELAKAGVSVSDILGGALSGSLGLAAAGQIGLADAATISAQAMNLFGLKGDDVTHIADVLAAGANKSAADVAQLGDALRQGGLVAAQTGLSLEETTGVLSLFADNALVGSDAGTSLKTMLQRLVPQSKEAASMMKELGLNFFDAQGEFVGIDEVAQQLQTSLGGLSDEQRNNALSTIFGSDAVRAASILMESGKQKVDEYTAAVNDQGAAARMAAAQLDNLKGDVEQFSGSIDTALIRIGDVFDPVERKVVQAGTSMVNVFNDFAATPAFDRIGQRVDLLASNILGSFTGVGDDISDTLAGISVADVDRVFDTIEAKVADFRRAIEGAEGVVAGLGVSIATMGLRALPFIGGIVPPIGLVAGALGGLVLGTDGGRDALGRLGDQASTTAQRLTESILPAVASVSDEMGTRLGNAVESIGTGALEAADILGPILGGAIEELGPPLSSLAEEIGNLGEAVLPKLAAGAGGIIDLFDGPLGVAIGVVADGVGLLADNVDLLIPVLAGVAAVRFGDTILGWGDSLRGVAGNVGGVKDAISNIASTQGVSKFEALKGVIGATGKEAAGLAGSFIAANGPLIALTGAVAIGASAWQSYQQNVADVESITSDLADALNETATKYQEQTAARARQVFVDKEALDVQNALGVSLGDLTNLVATNGDAVRRLDDLYAANSGSAAAWEASIATLPPAVQEVARSITDLVNSGDITSGDALQFFQALDELAQGTSGSLKRAKDEFTSLAQEAAASGKITAEQLATALDSIKNAKTPDELNAAFQQLATIIGDTGNSAQDASNKIRGLLDALQGLAGGQLAVDQAQRQFLDSQQRLFESFVKNGTSLDQATDAGRRNRDALDAQVKAAQDLATAQAGLDATGASSKATLDAQAAALADLRAQGIIPTEEEYQRLLSAYGLTPPQITTRVDADVNDAKRNAADLTQRLNEIPGVTKTEIAEIQALIDKGDITAAEQRLNAIDKRVLTVPIKVTGLGGLSAALFKAAGPGLLTGQSQGSVLSFYRDGGIVAAGVAGPAGRAGGLSSIIERNAEHAADSETSRSTEHTSTSSAHSARHDSATTDTHHSNVESATHRLDVLRVFSEQTAHDTTTPGQPGKPGKPGLPGAPGSIEHYAAGGMRERHVAQIAPAGAWRVWAEPETGGEAYIPLTPSKRKRSKDILAEVANRFGMQIVPYADGGVNAAGADLFHRTGGLTFADGGIVSYGKAKQFIGTTAGGVYQLQVTAEIGSEFFQALRDLRLSTDYRDGKWFVDGKPIGEAPAEDATFTATTTNPLLALNLDYAMARARGANVPADGGSQGQIVGAFADSTSKQADPVQGALTAIDEIVRDNRTLFLPTDRYLQILDNARGQGWKVRERNDQTAALTMNDDRVLNVAAVSGDRPERQGPYLAQVRKYGDVGRPAAGRGVAAETPGFDAAPAPAPARQGAAPRPKIGAGVSTGSTNNDGVNRSGKGPNYITSVDWVEAVTASDYGEEGVYARSVLQAYKRLSSGRPNGNIWEKAISSPDYGLEGQVAKAVIQAWVRIGAPAFANGGIVDAYAAGGVRERHVAQVAPAASWRVWAEPETGGEAYIPLSVGKRARSIEVLRDVAQRFGMQVFADGGVATGRPQFIPPSSPDNRRGGGDVSINVGQIVSPSPERVPDQLVRAGKELKAGMAF